MTWLFSEKQMEVLQITLAVYYKRSYPRFGVEVLITMDSLDVPNIGAPLLCLLSSCFQDRCCLETLRQQNLNRLMPLLKHTMWGQGKFVCCSTGVVSLEVFWLHQYFYHHLGMSHGIIRRQEAHPPFVLLTAVELVLVTHLLPANGRDAGE